MCFGDQCARRQQQRRFGDTRRRGHPHHRHRHPVGNSPAGNAIASPSADADLAAALADSADPFALGDTFTDTACNDTLNGTNHAEVICGLGGNGKDTLYGHIGNDNINVQDGGAGDTTSGC